LNSKYFPLRKSDLNKTLPTDMITIQELRSFPGLENLSDEEALEKVTSLYQLSQLAFQVFIEEQKTKSLKTENKEDTEVKF
jgi:hypothetical protein